MHGAGCTVLSICSYCSQKYIVQAINRHSLCCCRELIKERGLSDPNWFFQTLLEKPYLNNVIISPHYYPPTVSKSKSQCACSHCLQCFSCQVQN